jgi:hypothetical protein
MEKQLVIVSRKWHEPFIRVDLTEVGIGITMTLDDFITALESESGSSLRKAAERVVSGMKKESIQIL